MGIFKFLFLKGEYKIEIIRDEKFYWYVVNYLEGLEVVNFDDFLMLVIDLVNDESVQLGR